MEKEIILNKNQVFRELESVWQDDLLDEIRAKNEQTNQRLVILDDDPTGTQTVHDIPLLTEWHVPVLETELKQSRTFFILTNTRSLSEEDAVRLNREIGKNLKQASANTGIPFTVLSRSDSTLRGHYPAEVDALAQAIDLQPDATILVPYFEAGGRYTISDTHYVQMGDDLVPAELTEFARDKSFPFNHSYLPKYVEEKTEGRIPARKVESIDISTIRNEGPEGVFKKLLSFPKGVVIIINAANPRDLEVVVLALLKAQEAVKKYLYRTAAEFVSVLAGIRPKPLLNASNMRIVTKSGGLLVVGSHIKKSSEQLQNVLSISDIETVELDVEKFLDKNQRLETLNEYSSVINENLKNGKDVVAYTSRKLISAGDAASSLVINRSISDAVVQLIRNLTTQPKFLIAKGGITSNDIATKGLDVKRALVAGQLQPGIPVWLLGPESKFPNMHYVVYPGNVGAVDGLANAIKAFR